MFPPNHNNPIQVICSAWDKDKEEGQFFIEHNFMNAYINKQFTDLMSFKSQEELKDHVEKAINRIHAENNSKE